RSTAAGRSAGAFPTSAYRDDDDGRHVRNVAQRPPTYDREFVRFREIAFGPKPIHKPNPPMWMGGDADAVLRRAARFGDGWAPWHKGARASRLVPFDRHS